MEGYMSTVVDLSNTSTNKCKKKKIAVNRQV